MIENENLDKLMDIIIEDAHQLLKYKQTKKSKKMTPEQKQAKEYKDTREAIYCLTQDIHFNIKNEKPIPTVIKTVRILLSTILIIGVLSIGFSWMTANQTESKYLNIGGYSAFYIRTNSMIPVYPPGSMVVIKAVNPSSIEIGDDITYYDSNKTQDLITHRVTYKIDAYDNQGRVFQTKGINNEFEDKYLVSEDNVLGKVVYTVPYIGKFLTFIKENVVLVVVFFILLSILLGIIKAYYYDLKFVKVVEHK